MIVSLFSYLIILHIGIKSFRLHLLYDSKNIILILARPCQRCVKRGLENTCTDGARKKAKYLQDDESGMFLYRKKKKD